VRRRPPRWVFLALWGSAVAGYLVYARSRGLGPVDVAEELRSLLADQWWGVALFIVVYVARPVVLFPASVLTVLAGLAYGLWWGVVLTIIASNLSTAANYGVGRYLAPPTPAGQGAGPLRGAIGRAVDRPFESTMIMRLIALPFDAVGYLAGFARLQFWPFLAGSALGTVVGTVAFVAFGASIESLDEGTPTLDLRLVALSVGLTFGGIVAARWLRTRRPLDPEPAPLSPEVIP
jgi:uncharacterized membrane protein YdjX (TVP38/TMEM64 family)